MKQTKTTKIALVSLLTALSVVLGYFLKIPTPTGILTLLDAGVFFAAFYFGSREGAVVGGLAGFLIDLLSGYPQWMFFSLVNHGLQGLRLVFYQLSVWLRRPWTLSSNAQECLWFWTLSWSARKHTT